MPVAMHDDDPEMGAYGKGVVEETLHLLGTGIGGDVIVVGLHPEEHIAHAATGIEGSKPSRPKTLNQPPRSGFKDRHFR